MLKVGAIVPIVLAGGMLAFESFRWVSHPARPQNQDAHRLMVAADREFAANRRRLAIAAYVRAISLDLHAPVPRVQLAKILWSVYINHASTAPPVSLLFSMLAVVPSMAFDDSQSVQEMNPWIGLAYLELSRRTSDLVQAERWLDLAQNRARWRAIELLNSPDGASRLDLADFRFLLGQIGLRCHELGRADPEVLRQTIRNFWAAVSLAPESLRNRYYLSVALDLSERRETSKLIARSLFEAPDSGRGWLEGPSGRYRALARQQLGGGAKNAHH